MRPKRRRPAIGDILEIKTSKGLVYLQYTHERGPFASVVRWLPGYFAERPTDFTELARQPEHCTFQYLVPDSVRHGDMTPVGQAEIPERCRSYPWFRMAIRKDFEHGRVTLWRVGNETEWYHAEELTPEVRQIPLSGIWGHGLLMDRLESLWDPEHDPYHNGRIAIRDQSVVAGDDRPSTITHFLSFRTKPPTQAAGDALKALGYSVTSSHDPTDRRWPWTVAATRPDVGALGGRVDEVAQVKAIAASNGGEYDGHEVSL